MPSYKLIYFNMMGRAELTRWLFAYGGIEYTDERLNRENWPELKKSLPYPQVPILMVDGKPMPQSIAIARYAAKEVGLVPQDNLEAAYCDALVDTLVDIMAVMMATIRSDKSEEDKQKELAEKFHPNALAPFLVKLEKKMSDRQWFLGDKISWADIALGLIMGNLRAKVPAWFSNSPAVVKLVDRVTNIPSIKAWIAKRPQTAL